MRKMRGRAALALLLVSNAVSASAASAAGPSRKPVEGCAWQKRSEPSLGLEAWVQRCDFGFRKIDFLTQPEGLAIRYSDGGAPDRLIDVLPLREGESPEAGMRRVFAEKTAPAIASRCVLAPYRGPKGRRGVTRYVFVPDAAYAREVKAKEDPNEVGDPPCGEWGESPDGIAYFEAQAGSGIRRVLYVRIGQDEPLFDERSLRLLPGP